MAQSAGEQALPALHMKHMNVETPAEMATTLMNGVADNRFYVLGGLDGGKGIRDSAARRSDAIVNDQPPPFGGKYRSSRHHNLIPGTL